jgi:hypothetical protein
MLVIIHKNTIFDHNKQHFKHFITNKNKTKWHKEVENLKYKQQLQI